MKTGKKIEQIAIAAMDLIIVTVAVLGLTDWIVRGILKG